MKNTNEKIELTITAEKEIISATNGAIYQVDFLIAMRQAGLSDFFKKGGEKNV